MAAGNSDDLVVIMAPTGADATNIRTVLARISVTSEICRTTAELRGALSGGCGAIVLTEEALTPEVEAVLGNAFAAQPPWSDLPVVVISSAAASGASVHPSTRLSGPHRTVTILERPLRSATLIATLETLFSARRRQYEIRDLLHERDALLSSLETRVAQRTAELQRMVEEMEAFSYSVSHDLRSPLRSLAGYAQALQEDYAHLLPDGAQVYCDKIIRAAQRMDRLTQDVLAYTRVTRCEMEITVVDLDTLVQDVIEQYPALGSSAPFIHLHRPLGLVKGHVPSLIQCFSNLLGNAVKFVPPGTVPAVHVRTALRGKVRRISVCDNGRGIAPADQQRVFQMFERAAGKDVPGTGIGLAIAKKAVERMGGSIGVNSALGQGAEFWIELEAVHTPDLAPVDDAMRNWKPLATDTRQPAVTAL